jgi:hypothetical protein
MDHADIRQIRDRTVPTCLKSLTNFVYRSNTTTRANENCVSCSCHHRHLCELVTFFSKCESYSFSIAASTACQRDPAGIYCEIARQYGYTEYSIMDIVCGSNGITYADNASLKLAATCTRTPHGNWTEHPATFTYAYDGNCTDGRITTTSTPSLSTSAPSTSVPPTPVPTTSQVRASISLPSAGAEVASHTASFVGVVLGLAMYAI